MGCAGPAARRPHASARPRAGTLLLELHRRAPRLRAWRRRVDLPGHPSHHGSEPIENVGWNYGVLAASFLFEGFSWVVALREFREQKGSAGYVVAITRSKDPTTFHRPSRGQRGADRPCHRIRRHLPRASARTTELDGVASVGIGIVLAGRRDLPRPREQGSADRRAGVAERAAAILHMAEADPAIQKANGVITTHLGSAPDRGCPQRRIRGPHDGARDRSLRPAAGSPRESRTARCDDRLRKPQTAGTWAKRASAIR